MTTPRTLVELARARAESDPDAPFVTQLAVDEGGAARSRARLVDGAARVAGWLAERKVRRGDRVALLARNDAAVFPLLLGCAARGAILAPLNPDLRSAELLATLARLKPAVTLDAHARKLPTSTTPLADALAGAAPTSDDPGRPEDPVLTIQTSGTTSAGKSVLLTQQNLLAMAASLTRFYRLTPRDRLLCVLPTYHVNAIVITGLAPLYAGASVALSDVFGVSNARSYWRTADAERVTVLSLVPSILKLLIALFPGGRDAPCESARFAFCGAAPLPASLWREFETHFELPVYQGYGLTETTCWAAFTPPDQPRRYDTVGVPVDCELRIEDGEVQVRGDLVMPGYLKAPSETRAAFTADGFFRSGDLGAIDGDGFLRITGRIKDILIKNGVNISPAEIDDVLAEHPDVEECRTVGMPDEWVGERIHTVCVPRRGRAVTAAELRAWVAERVSEYKRPDRLTVAGWLPRGPTGKIATGTLRKLLSGELRDQLVGAWSAWRLRRAPPSGAAEIGRVVQEALIAGRPIALMMPWGCGDRAALNEADRSALAQLVAFVQAGALVEAAPPALTLVLTDVHARLNGKLPQDVAAYFSAVERAAGAAGFGCARLSKIWLDAGLSLDDVTARAPDGDPAWADEGLRRQLVKQAARHARGADAEDAARRYFLACRAERDAVAAHFAGAIALSYTDPKMDSLLPSLPTFFLFPIKPRHSERPWFTSD